MTSGQDDWLERLRLDHPAWKVRMAQHAYLCEYPLKDGYVVISGPDPVVMGFRMTELEQRMTGSHAMPKPLAMRYIDL